MAKDLRELLEHLELSGSADEGAMGRGIGKWFITFYELISFYEWLL